jgi:hypothetical protein
LNQLETYLDSFFSFRTFEIEVEYKLQSANYNSDLYYQVFKEYLVSKKIKSLESLDSIHNIILNKFKAEPYKNYMHHPYRVTHSYISALINPTVNDAIFGLGHNIKELGIDLGESFDKDSYNKVQTLTIDRKREKDKFYRKEFYDRIEDYSPDLMLFKAFDKLDNTLSWVLLDLERYHIDVLIDEVCPRVSKVNQTLSAYLLNLVDFVLDFKNKKFYKEKYA